MFRFCLILIAIFCLNYSANAEFPADPKPCKYDDSECLTKIIEYFIREKSQGDSSINLVNTDPMTVKKMVLKQGGDSPVKIDMTFTNNEIYGFSKAKVLKVKGFGKNITQAKEIIFRVAQTELVGDYNIKGKILILPITGTGKSNLTMKNPEITIKFTTSPLKKDDGTYMKIENFQLDAKISRLIFKIDNLFNGDKALSDNMNLFLNENWSDIYNEIKGTLGVALGKIFKKVIEGVFKKNPYENLFAE